MSEIKKFYAALASLSAVIALQNLITFGVNLADNVMIGGYSQAALNGVTIVNQIQFLLQMFAGGVANGMVVLAAQYWDGAASSRSSGSSPSASGSASLFPPL